VKRWRILAFALFVAISLGGTCYYLGEPLHQAQLANARDWWEGITGRQVTEHRPGIQLAWVDPATGRLTGVRDAFGLVDPVRQAMAELPPDRLLAITVLQMGDSDVLPQLTEMLRTEASWDGDLAPASAGAAAIVLQRGPSGLQVVAQQLSAEPRVTLDLGKGFHIVIKEY
jgi:hypothetical protein